MWVIRQQKKRTEMVKHLLKHGADINVQSKDGLTARMVAANNNEWEIAEILNDKALELSEKSKEVEKKTYYLGVDSIKAAINTIDILSFFTVVDKKTAQVKYAHEGRMAVGIHPIKDPAGAVVFITGAFTPQEMNEIEALSQYEHIPLRKAVSNVVTQTIIDSEKKGVRTTHQILGKPE